MNKKNFKSLMHDVNAIFDCIVYKVEDGKNWYEIHLAHGYRIGAPDFPHLLVVASGYNVRVNIFPIYPDQLGIFFVENS